MSAGLQDAYRLFHRGTMTFSDMSRDGIRVDVPYLEEMYNSVLPPKIEAAKEKLKQHKEVKKWIKREGRNWSPDSDPQLKHVLYNQMRLEPINDKKTDKKTMTRLGVPFADDMIEYRKFYQCRNTFIKGLLDEQVDGFIHTDMSLVIPVSYRGSCKRPNLQNQPNRDDDIAQIVRRAFIPRDGHQFTEYDFKGAEVSINCCYCQDPNLIEYLEDPSKDMHWDGARDVFIFDFEMTDFDDYSMRKAIRDKGKGELVFPEFYGSWWLYCAENLWWGIDDLILPNGVSLRRNLAKHGITELGEVHYDRKGRIHVDEGTFYDHVRKVEDKLWNTRFPVYRDWKTKWYDAYKKRGWFKQRTGFIETGMMKRNDTTNHPAQGTAFHVLLETANRKMDFIYDKGVDSYMVLQVHDSIIEDHHPDEANRIDAKTKTIVQDEIPELWDWINVPLVIECERAPVNGSWYETEEVEL